MAGLRLLALSFLPTLSLLGGIAACNPGPEDQQTRPRQQVRFESAGTPEEWEEARQGARVSEVTTDISVLDVILASGQPFELTVLGRTLQIAPASRSLRQAGVWNGMIQDAPGITGGRALIIRNGNNVFIRLYTGQFGYQIATQKNGTIVAEEVDIGTLPEESEPEDSSPDAFDGLKEARADMQQQTIDVLLLYDPALKAKLDNIPNGMQNFLIDRQQGLDDLYLNGRNHLPVRVRIRAHALYTGLVSTSITQQSAYLKNWSKFETLRTQHQADLVALISNNINGSCGIAPLYNKGNDVNARSVTDIACEYKYTLGHEIGHNLGANHVRGGNTTKTRCNFGYRIANVARTVMAYGCANNSCPRKPYFSDITVKEGQHAMGKTCGTSTGAQNVLTVRNTIPVVAAFRPKI